MDIAEYLLKHETMEAEEFNYYFEHGEFMPMTPKQSRAVREDSSIERPARKISMVSEPAEAPAVEEAPAEPSVGTDVPGGPEPTPEEKTEE